MIALLAIVMMSSVITQCMDVTKYFSSINSKNELCSAIRSNSFNAIYHFLDKNKTIPFAYDKDEIHKLTLFNILKHEESMTSIKEPLIWGVLGFFSMYAAHTLLGSLYYEDKPHLTKEDYIGLGGIGNVAFLAGWYGWARALINYDNKEAYKNAVAIRKLLTDRKIIAD